MGECEHQREVTLFGSDPKAILDQKLFEISRSQEESRSLDGESKLDR